MSVKKPPRFIERLIKLVCREELVEEILGDLFEYYQECGDKKPIHRWFLYLFHALHFMRPRLLRRFTSASPLNFLGKLQLNLRISIRSLLRNKVVASLSMVSLIIGAVCFQMVNAWLLNEHSMNLIHDKGDRIHLMIAKFNPKTDWAAFDVARVYDLDYDQLPEIEESTLVHTYNVDEIKLSTGLVTHSGKGLVVDSTFLDIFDFPIIEGNLSALQDPNSILLTTEYAKRVFGEENPIGKRLTVTCDQHGTYQVGAVLKDIPSNSSITFDFLVPRHSKNFWRRMPQSIVLLHGGVNADSFRQKVSLMGQGNERFPESLISTVPLNELYSKSPIRVSLFEKYGNHTILQNMQWVAVVILLITIMTFVNLQTSFHLTLANKLGIKQAVGATRLDVIFELLVSRMIYLVVAFVAGFVIYQSVFPYYVQLLGLDLDVNPLMDLWGIGSVVLLSVAISWFALFIQSLKIDMMSVLSGTFKIRSPRIQRVLLTGQFAITIVLLVATFVVYLQVRYMLNKDTGIDHQNIISFDLFEIAPNGSQDSVARIKIQNDYLFAREQLSQNSSIDAITQGRLPLGEAYRSSWKIVSDGEEYLPVKTMPVDPGYDDVFGLQMKEGRFFSDTLDSSDDYQLVINESAQKLWGIDDIHNVRLVTNTRGNNQQAYSIIGVVEDYHFEHMANEVSPLVLSYFVWEDQTFLIKASSNEYTNLINDLEALHDKINPTGIFTYDLAENQFEEQYAKEKNTSVVYNVFSVIALVLSMIGLFTFAYHETNRRIKEVGIRKVVGAGTGNIFWLLNKPFIKSVSIAFFLATPLVYFLMQNWLQNFGNRIELHWWIFLLTGVFILIVSTLTVAARIIGISSRNPVESLRYE